MRTEPLELPTLVVLPGLALPGPELGSPPKDLHTEVNPFVGGITMRVIEGGFREPGPATVWYRIERRILADADTTPSMRAAIVADFSNGSSSVLSYDTWTFMNADLSVSLVRPPQGEWILSQSMSWIGPDGIGLSSAILSDLQGAFGRATQTIVVEKRRR